MGCHTGFCYRLQQSSSGRERPKNQMTKTEEVRDDCMCGLEAGAHHVLTYQHGGPFKLIPEIGVRGGFLLSVTGT